MFWKLNIFECCRCNSGKDCEMSDLKEPIFKVNLNFYCCAVSLKETEYCMTFCASYIYIKHHFGIYFSSDV